MKRGVLFIAIIPIILLLLIEKLNTDTPVENLVNKVNAIDNQWIDYNGAVELDNNMTRMYLTIKRRFYYNKVA